MFLGSRKFLPLSHWLNPKLCDGPHKKGCEGQKRPAGRVLLTPAITHTLFHTLNTKCTHVGGPLSVYKPCAFHPLTCHHQQSELKHHVAYHVLCQPQTSNIHGSSFVSSFTNRGSLFGFVHSRFLMFKHAASFAGGRAVVAFEMFSSLLITIAVRIFATTFRRIRS
jgi:hypothetical protein